MTDGMKVNILYTKPLLTDGDSASDGEGFSNVEEVQCSSESADANSRCSKGLRCLKLLLDQGCGPHKITERQSKNDPAFFIILTVSCCYIC